METTNSNRCYTCKYWTGNQLERDLERSQGECRRYPPQVAGLIPRQAINGIQHIAMTTFPTVNALAGCGEHTSAVVLTS